MFVFNLANAKTNAIEDEAIGLDTKHLGHMSSGVSIDTRYDSGQCLSFVYPEALHCCLQI